MPQVAAHFVIADRVRPLLSVSDQALIAAHPEAYKLGAIGPDMSFFLLDGAFLRPVIQAVIDVYIVISDIMKLFSEIASLVLGPAADMLDWLTGGLSTATFELVGRAFDALVKAAALLLLPGVEVDVENPFAGVADPPPGVSTAPTIRLKAGHLSTLFRAFGHPYTFDPPYKPFMGPHPRPDDMREWWWMDVLHYRRTGLFASALLRNAADDRERAYARGWMTHVAGDVCGHPYINAIVGGPFRNHAHRHLVVERVVDTWVHERFTGEDIVIANLQKRCDVGDGFGAIARLLNRTIDEIYVNPASGSSIRTELLDGPRPSEDEWERAFELLMRHLELSTGTGFAPPDPPPGNPAELFEEIKDHIANSAKKVPGQFTGKNKKWWEWLLAPFVAAGYALSTFFKIMTLPAGVMLRAAGLGPRWLLYFLQKALYSCVLDLRWTLTLGGFGVASRADLSRTLAQAWIRVPAIRSGGSAMNYPHAMAPRVDGFWLFDPAQLNTPIESGPVLVGDPRQPQCSPYPPGALPDSFIEGRPFDQVRQAELNSMASALNSPHQTISLEQQTYSRTPPFTDPQFGSAVEFCAKLLNDPAPGPLGSFDLDGDMGYGFLNWERGGLAPTPPQFSQITSISALLAIDFSVMCGTLVDEAVADVAAGCRRGLRGPSAACA